MISQFSHALTDLDSSEIELRRFTHIPKRRRFGEQIVYIKLSKRGVERVHLSLITMGMFMLDFLIRFFSSLNASSCYVSSYFNTIILNTHLVEY